LKLFILLISLCVVHAGLNNRPIIGILTQPGNGGYGDVAEDLQNKTQYIAASYVKFVESGGARVVPIFYNSTKDQLDQLFDSINGILLPGGGADFKGKFWETSQYLYQKILRRKQQR